MHEHFKLLDDIPDTELGDRHLFGILNKKQFDVQGMSPNNVQVLAEAEYVTTVAGQHLLFMLLNLVSRLYGVVSHLILDIPDVPTVTPYTHLGATLRDATAEHLRLIRGSLDRVSMQKLDKLSDTSSVTVGVGFPKTGNEEVKYAWAEGWNLYVGSDVLKLSLPQSNNPVGPFFAACVLASEVFKKIGKMRNQSGKYASHFYFSLWTNKIYSSWEEMPPQNVEDIVRLPELNIVGIGAVGQAAVATLGVMPSLQVDQVILIDDDKYDNTNHNRCVLATAEDIANQTLKVDIGKRYLQANGMLSATSPEKWQTFAFESPYRNRDYKYEWVFSCVDKNVARHSIQSFSPTKILGGSTVNMTVNITLYQKGSTFECLKCYNKPEEPPTIEERGGRLKDLNEEDLKRLCKKMGADIDRVKQYLTNPVCGSLGEMEMQKFESTEIDASVGFVSVAAGVTMVAKLYKVLVEGAEEAFSPTTLNQFFNFLHLNTDSYPVKRRKGCSCNETS
jgi:molybdopterin/thiamine biosynthesis adenylyltransferase